jgi:hypothetical protein
MTASYDKAYFVKLGVPDRVLSLIIETPRLLPGECREDFFACFETMLNELLPSTDLEWFLTVDLGWMLWDIQRYRRWRNAIVWLNQRTALAEALLRINPSYSTLGPTEMLRKTTQLKADALKGNAKGDPAIARELEDYGYSQDALNALAFLKGAVSVEVIEKFAEIAHRRLMKTLREVAVRREFGARLRLMEKRIEAERRQLQANQQGLRLPAKVGGSGK